MAKNLTRTQHRKFGDRINVSKENVNNVFTIVYIEALVNVFYFCVCLRIVSVFFSYSTSFRIVYIFHEFDHTRIPVMFCIILLLLINSFIICEKYL